MILVMVSKSHQSFQSEIAQLICEELTHHWTGKRLPASKAVEGSHLKAECQKRLMTIPKKEQKGRNTCQVLPNGGPCPGYCACPWSFQETRTIGSKRPHKVVYVVVWPHLHFTAECCKHSNRETKLSISSGWGRHSATNKMYVLEN